MYVRRPILVQLLLAAVQLPIAVAQGSTWNPWNGNEGTGSIKDGPDYVLIGTAENVTLNCVSRYSVIFNGTTPGPKLYLQENATTWVRVYNNIPDQNLTVHWHGLSMRTDIFSDGTPQVSQYPIAPFNYFDYSITPAVGDAGSYFYHSHVGFQAITAAGVLIVKDAEEPPYQYDNDIAILMQDFYAKNDSIMEEGLLASPFKWTGEPDAFLFNGKSGNKSFTDAKDESCKPELISIVPGQINRIRFISGAALSFVTLGIEDHENLTIIEADGEYTNPWSTDRLQLGSGQRFSILLQGKTAEELQALGKSSFWLRYESRDRPTNVTGYALIQYQTQDTSLPSTLPETSPVILPADVQNVSTWSEYSLSSYDKSLAADFPRLNEVTRTVYITMRQVGAYNGSFTGTLKWAQNDLSWTAEASEDNNTVPYLIQVYTTGTTPNYTAALANNGWDPIDQRNAFPALVGEVLDIVWLSNNGPSGGWDAHPWHAHGAHYYDLGSGNGTYDAVENEKHFSNYIPAKRDTTMLHRYAVRGVPETTAGWRAWRLRITEDNVGAWLMHCHVLGHMTMGMQTTWVMGTASEILQKFPVVPYVDGYLEYGGDAYGNQSFDPFVDGIYGH